LKPITIAAVLGVAYLATRSNQPPPVNHATTSPEEAAPILADIGNSSAFVTQDGVTVGEIFSSDAVIAANLGERALDEGWTAPQLLAALQPGYTDPTVIPERQVIPNATISQLEEQSAALRHRGGTYDMWHAMAIDAYLAGITSEIVPWPQPGSGSAGRALLRAHPEVYGVQ